jgi:hypothetical protein
MLRAPGRISHGCVAMSENGGWLLQRLVPFSTGRMDGHARPRMQRHCTACQTIRYRASRLAASHRQCRVHGLRVSGLLRDTRAHAKQGIGGVNLNTAMRRALIQYDGIESHGLKCDIGGTYGGTFVLVGLNSQTFQVVRRRLWVL